MGLLILGLALWCGAHWFKRIAPDARARLGDPGKGLVAVLLLGSVVLMVMGYRAAAPVQIWVPPSFLIHINNLLMLGAVWMFVSSLARPGVRLAAGLKHNQLVGAKVWAVAHFLVNGDLASIVLFGGILVWAVVSVILINKGTDDFNPEAAPITSTPVFVVVFALAFVLIAGVHIWLGVWPFGGA